MSGAGGHEANYEEKRRQALQWFAAHCDWLQEDAPIPYELAEGLVRASAWWIAHRDGPVEAPRDAEHVTLGPYGWRVYTSNSFEISLFIRRARRLICQAYGAAIQGRKTRRRRLLEDIAAEGVYCVSNHVDDLYPFYGETDWLPSGNHAIATLQAALYLLEQSRYIMAIEYKPREQRLANATPGNRPKGGKTSRSKSARSQPQLQRRRQRQRQKRLAQQVKQTAKNRDAKPDLTEQQRQWAKERLSELAVQFGGLSQYERDELKHLLKELAPLKLADKLTTEQDRHRELLEDTAVIYVQGMRARREGPPPEPPPAPQPPATPTRERRKRRRRGGGKRVAPRGAAAGKGREAGTAASAGKQQPQPKRKGRRNDRQI